MQLPLRALPLLACFITATSASAQTMLLSTSSSDYQTSTIFSDVEQFSITIEINAPMVPGVYNDPEIINVTYRVTGDLEPDTPSGFESFDLQRIMTGDEFYAQGSALSFEISPTAVLSDGIQAAELVGDGVVLTFNGREIDTRRFHPALFELNSDGTGRIQNSNNIPSQDPLVEVEFGEEYITDLMFDPGNTTLITESTPPPSDDDDDNYIYCFIATAAYGSYFEPEVKVLRNFRDKQLLPYRYGRAFVDWYYATSPLFAAYIAKHDSLRALTRGALMPVVFSIKYPAISFMVGLLLVLLLIKRLRLS